MSGNLALFARSSPRLASTSCAESIKKNFEGLDAYGKNLALTRLVADEQNALAITANVAVTAKPNQQGPLSIRLIKVDKRWLIRDIDLGSDRAGKNIKRFFTDHPGGKDVDLKLKVKLSQKERITTLKELVHQAATKFRAARASYEEVLEAQLQLLKAELDAAEKESDRITLYKNIVDVLKNYETFAEAKVKDGRKPRSFFLKVKARRLEAESDLERAKEAKESK